MISFGSIPFGFLFALLGMGIAIENPKTFHPYDGLARFEQHQGWWHGGNHWWNHAEGPHRCQADGTNPPWTVGKRLCGGVHIRYWKQGDGFVGGYAQGNDTCRANPWNRDSAWVCR